MKRLSLGILGVLSLSTLFACSSSTTAANKNPATNDAGGGAGGGGTGGAGGFKPTGTAITAPNLAWTWVDFPDSFCRDGSTAGISVSLTDASDKVMIYLEAGGACFDSFTCGAANPANADAQKGGHATGLFDRTNALNPVKDWNFVYVPYCTGDIHAGTNENGSIQGVTGTQKFVGRRNMEAYLNRIVPTFPKPGQVFLTGISAGGFGAAASADLVARAFGSVPMTLIDDSGPSMSSQYLPACLQDKWRALWGFDDSILKDCGAACPKKDDYTVDFSKFLAKKYPNRESGLLESNDDGTITGFYGYGQNNCTGSFTTPVPAAQYDAALLDLRTQMAAYPKFLTYYPASTQHTWLGGASLYTEAEGGTKLIDWVTAILNNAPAQNVGQ